VCVCVCVCVCVQTAMGAGLGDVRPLDKERLRRFRMNRVQLVDLIDLKDGLLDVMFSVGCITRQQKDAIREVSSSSAEKNRKLVDILTRRSVVHYDQFLACLRRHSQSHVANVLQDDAGLKRNFACRFVGDYSQYSQ